MAILPWNSTKLWQRVFSCIRSASVKPTHYAQLLCFKSDLQVMKSRHRRRDQVNSDWISDIVATVLVRHFSSFHWGFWYSVVFPSCCRNHFWVLRNLLLILTVGTLRSKDADDNENVKKTIGLISKTTTSHVQHTFCSFLSRFCTTTTWKCLILRFMEDVNKQRRNSIFLIVLGYGA